MKPISRLPIRMASSSPTGGASWPMPLASCGDSSSTMPETAAPKKRGGNFEITSSDDAIGSPPDPQELTKISDALDELATSEASLAEIVDLKFFCGFTFGEI